MRLVYIKFGKLLSLSCIYKWTRKPFLDTQWIIVCENSKTYQVGVSRTVYIKHSSSHVSRQSTGPPVSTLARPFSWESHIGPTVLTHTHTHTHTAWKPHTHHPNTPWQGIPSPPPPRLVFVCLSRIEEWLESRLVKMTFWLQLRILVWKNFIMRRRQVVSATFSFLDNFKKLHLLWHLTSLYWPYKKSHIIIIIIIIIPFYAIYDMMNVEKFLLVLTVIF